MLKTLWHWLRLNVNSCLQTLYSLDMHVRSVGRRTSGGALYEIIFGLNVAKNRNFTAICVHIRHTKKEIWSDTLLCSISWKCRVEVGISYCGSEWHSFLFLNRSCHSSISICGNKMPTRCNRDFYCRSYRLLNMFRAPLCPSSGAQEYYTVVAACGISCCGFQVVGLVWSWGICVRFAGCCSILQTGHITLSSAQLLSNHCIILLSSWSWA